MTVNVSNCRANTPYTQSGFDRLSSTTSSVTRVFLGTVLEVIHVQSLKLFLFTYTLVYSTAILSPIIARYCINASLTQGQQFNIPI